ncbi:hypothetical protein HDU79_004442 [Rhizoclosmatium sp. JEL0117]|nr:hypothetical protein HDU79_004442 [Rhizoclosmatium sp. JEL0117]
MSSSSALLRLALVALLSCETHALVLAGRNGNLNPNIVDQKSLAAVQNCAGTFQVGTYDAQSKAKLPMTCSAIQSATGMSVAELVRLNPGLDCSVPVAFNTFLCVDNPDADAGTSDSNNNNNNGPSASVSGLSSATIPTSTSSTSSTSTSTSSSTSTSTFSSSSTTAAAAAPPTTATSNVPAPAPTTTSVVPPKVVAPSPTAQTTQVIITTTSIVPPVVVAPSPSSTTAIVVPSAAATTTAAAVAVPEGHPDIPFNTGPSPGSGGLYVLSWNWFNGGTTDCDASLTADDLNNGLYAGAQNVPELCGKTATFTYKGNSVTIKYAWMTGGGTLYHELSPKAFAVLYGMPNAAIGSDVSAFKLVIQDPGRLKDVACTGSC